MAAQRTAAHGAISFLVSSWCLGAVLEVGIRVSFLSISCHSQVLPRQNIHLNQHCSYFRKEILHDIANIWTFLVTAKCARCFFQFYRCFFYFIARFLFCSFIFTLFASEKAKQKGMQEYRSNDTAAAVGWYRAERMRGTAYSGRMVPNNRHTRCWAIMSKNNMGTAPFIRYEATNTPILQDTQSPILSLTHILLIFYPFTYSF